MASARAPFVTELVSWAAMNATRARGSQTMRTMRQNRQHRKRQQSQSKIEDKHHNDDAQQQCDIAHRNHHRLEKTPAWN